MKLPFDFGIKLVFRLVIPGFILSLGFLPMLHAGLQVFGWSARFEYAFAILIILMGWLITISDMRIYMFLEGRRWWPGPIREICKRSEQRRLARLIERSKSDDEQVAAEAYFDLRNFPMEMDGEYVVMYPSRLGNLLRAFERYSSRTYGADSTFYWWRIWLKLDKDTKEEIDGSQALADSTAYAAFAMFASGMLMLLYLSFRILKVIGHRFVPAGSEYLPSFVIALDQYIPRKVVAACLATVFLLSGFLVYRFSLYLHAQFGELFKSILDLHVAEINISGIIREISILSEKSPSVSLSKRLNRRDQFPIAARYMQYYRYRCPNPKCNALLKPSEIGTHAC